jgi:hypothetical protein
LPPSNLFLVLLHNQKEEGERGHPFLNPLSSLKKVVVAPFINNEKVTEVTQFITLVHKWNTKP